VKKFSFVLEAINVAPEKSQIYFKKLRKNCSQCG